MPKFATSLAIAGLFAVSQAVFADEPATEKTSEKTTEKTTETAPLKASTKTPAALNFKVKSLDDKDVDLADYQGKVVLIVNVASKCGLTPQYKALEALYEKYKDQGLVIVGFPCNQFHNQEPGTAAEISTFCTSKYGVTFPLMAKVEVNGGGACDLYKYLKSLDIKPKGTGEVTWNFEKFVIGRNGEVVGRFKPQTTPDATEVTSLIESELAKAAK
jgi:glutathione peroxidase